MLCLSHLSCSDVCTLLVLDLQLVLFQTSVCLLDHFQENQCQVNVIEGNIHFQANEMLDIRNLRDLSDFSSSHPNTSTHLSLFALCLLALITTPSTV